MMLMEGCTCTFLAHVVRTKLCHNLKNNGFNTKVVLGDFSALDRGEFSVFSTSRISSVAEMGNS